MRMTAKTHVQSRFGLYCIHQLSLVWSIQPEALSSCGHVSFLVAVQYSVPSGHYSRYPSASQIMTK